MTLLIVCASVLAGFVWGCVFTFHTYVLPARKKFVALLDRNIEFLNKQAKAMRELIEVVPEVGPDGSMLSPIQIKKD